MWGSGKKRQGRISIRRHFSQQEYQVYRHGGVKEVIGSDSKFFRMFSVWNLEGDENREQKKQNFKGIVFSAYSTDMNAIEIYLFYKHYIHIFNIFNFKET